MSWEGRCTLTFVLGLYKYSPRSQFLGRCGVPSAVPWSPGGRAGQRVHAQHQGKLSFASEMVEDYLWSLEPFHYDPVLFRCFCVSPFGYIITQSLTMSFQNMERPHTQDLLQAAVTCLSFLEELPCDLSQSPGQQQRACGRLSVGRGDSEVRDGLAWLGLVLSLEWVAFFSFFSWWW